MHVSTPVFPCSFSLTLAHPHRFSGFKFAEMELSTCILRASLSLVEKLYCVELALSVLLETFVFSPGSKEIEWMMAGLQSPVVKGSDDITPQLPLKVSFAK